MNGSLHGAIDYGRFAERLAAQRADPDPARRWELYREFQEEWGYVPTGGKRWAGGEPVDSGDEELGEELDEDQLAALVPPERIPAALTEWWRLPFNSFADSWRMYWTNPVWPPTWRPDPSGYGVSEGLEPDSPLVVDPDDLRLCCFKAEYEYCNEWAYLSVEGHLPDPQVFVSTEEGWMLQADSLSEFFLLLAVTRLPDSLGWSARYSFEDDDEFDAMAARIAGTMPELGFHPWRELMMTKVFHGGPDVLASVDPTGDDFQLAAYGRTKEALDRLLAELGGEWELFGPQAPEPAGEDGEDGG